MEDHIVQGIKRHVIPELIDETRALASDSTGLDSLAVIYRRDGEVVLDYAGETPSGVFRLVEQGLELVDLERVRLD